MNIKITKYEPSNQKQETLEENQQLIKEFKETVDNQLKDKIKQFKCDTDNLTEKDIQIIMDISSETVSSYFKEYGKLLANSAQTFRHTR